MVDKTDSDCHGSRNNNNNKHHGKHVDNLTHREGVYRRHVKVGPNFYVMFFFPVLESMPHLSGSWLDSSRGTHGARLHKSIYKTVVISQRAVDCCFLCCWDQNVECSILCFIFLVYF